MYRSKNLDETIAMTTRALSWTPLEWQPYFLRAQAKVDAKSRANAIADFRRARFLEPNAFQVPFEEGMFWLRRRQPILAITAWREALQRAGARRLELYGEMFFDSSTNNRFLAELVALGARDPALMLAALDRVPGDRFAFVCGKFLELDPDLRRFTPEQKDKLLTLWAERGNMEEFARAVERHPGWRAAGWRGMAKYQASKQDYRSAVELILEFAPPPVMPPANESVSFESLQQQFRADASNFSVGYALYHEQMRQQNVDDALATVRHFTALPGVPSYFYFLELEAWAAKGNWERAWDSWLKFARANKR
jgi:tetratricopeptide (TPR) repeat protein